MKTPIRRNQPDGSPGAQAQVSVGTNPTSGKPAMPRIDEPDTLSPVDRRRETARILARAVLRIGTRSAASSEKAEELSESSRARLAIRPCSATHVTVREDVNAKPEDRK
jgi:hypothetical protein